MSLRFSSALVVLGSVAFSLGCAPMPYRPNEDRVKELGVEKAKQDLKEMVMRSKAAGGGVVTSVEVTDDALKLKAQQSSLGMFYQVETRQLENEAYFPMLERVDIYSNNWAYVYQGGRLVMQVLLATPEDARSFADLMMSFHAHRKPASP